MELNEQTQKAFGVVSKEEAEEINGERSLFNKIFNPIESRVVSDDVKNLLLDPSVVDPEFDTRDLLALKSDEDFMEEYANAQNERAALKRKESENSFRNTGYDFLTEKLNLDPSIAQGVVTAAEFVPFVGDLPMIEDAVDQFKRGDIKEGALTTTLAVAGIAFDGIPLIINGIKKASKPAQVFSGDFGEEEARKNIIDIATKKRPEVIEDANEEVLDILRKEYPDMEKRGEIYKVGVLKTDKGVDSTTYDVTIVPQDRKDGINQLGKTLTMIDRYPDNPNIKQKILYDKDLATVEYKDGENKIVPDLTDNEARFRSVVSDVSPGDITKSTDIRKVVKGFNFNYPQEKNRIFRGMSNEEFQESFKRGYFKSEGFAMESSPRQKGATYFTNSPDEAAAFSNTYAESGFKATPNNPSIVVEIDAPRKGQFEVIDELENPIRGGILGEIPFSRVRGIYRGEVYVARGNAKITTDPKKFGLFEGDNVFTDTDRPYDSDVIWEKLYIEDFNSETRKQALKRDFRKNYPNVTELDTVKDPQSINNLMKKMSEDMSKTRTRSTDFRFDASTKAYEKGFYRDFEINTQFVIPEEKIEGISYPAKFYTVKGFDVQQIPKTADFLPRQKRRAEIENQSDVLVFNYDNIFLRPKVILKDEQGKITSIFVDRFYDRQGKPKFKEYKGPKEI
jgi:hypothetical protein